MVVTSEMPLVLGQVVSGVRVPEVQAEGLVEAAEVVSPAGLVVSRVPWGSL